MLALYARYNCTSNADAYREICEALGRYTPRPRVNDCIGVKPEQNARAAPQEIHQTYSLLLSMLPLTPTHKAHLLSPQRGLTEKQIARFGFKSAPPAFLCRSYAERLRRQGCTLQGVPGFYQDDAGRWTINFGSRTAGILLPLSVWMVLFAACRYGWTHRCAAGMTHRAKAEPSTSGCRQSVSRMA